jgi:CP family cyanate transporter-like MFS transporter
MLAVLMIAGIPAGIIAARPRTVEEEWSRRHGAW